MKEEECELCFDSKTMTNFDLTVLNPDVELENDGEGTTHFNIETPHTIDRLLDWTKEIVEPWVTEELEKKT
jgi:hypothetical protein